MKHLLVLLLTVLATVQTKYSRDELKDKLKAIAQSPLVNLVFIYDSDKMKSADVEGFLGHMAENKRGYFVINIFDCQQVDEELRKEFTYCQEENIPKLPTLMFTEPVLNLQNEELNRDNLGASQVGYQGAAEQKKLFQFAQPLMKTYSRVLKSLSDLKRFKDENSKVPRIVYITDKEKLSTYYKALTANFRHTIAFAHVQSNNTKICNSLNVTKFPVLLLNEKESLDIDPQLPKQIDYLRQFAAPNDTTIYIPSDYKTGDEPIQSAEDLENKVIGVARYSIIHVIEDKEHPAWKGLKKKLGGGFDYFVAGKEMASLLGVKTLPSIVFYHKSIVKKDSMRTSFNEMISLRDIMDEIVSLIDDHSISIGSHEEMQRHTSVAFKDNHKVVFLFFSDEVPIGYRLLSNSQDYKNKLQFYKFKNPEASVLTQLQISKKLPVISVMYVSDEEFNKEEIKQMDDSNKQRQGAGVEYRLRLAQYNGVLTYDDMKVFVDSILKQTNRKATQQSGDYNQEDDNRQEKDLVHIKSSRHLNKYCIRESCYMVIVDNNPEYSNSSKKAINYTRSITKRVNDNVVWMDGVCYPQLMAALEVQTDDLPVLVYLNHKFEKYSKLIGRMTAESPNLFVSKVKNNKVNYRQYDKLEMEDKQCDQEHARIDALKFASSELTEQEKEILEEIKKDEEKRRKEAQEATAKAKRKPKKKAPKKEQSDSEL